MWKLLAALIIINAPGQRVEPSLASVTQRAISYVTRYEASLGNLIGTEEYQQTATWNNTLGFRATPNGRAANGLSDVAPARTIRRNTSADFLLIQVGTQWTPLREVNEVDGVKAANQEETFPFDDSPANNTKRFNSMKADSAKYNIGDVVREMNLPTFALEVLRQEEASRFEFEKNGVEKIAGISAWRVRFREARGRALVSTANGRNIYSSGTLWIDPDSGAVLKTELDLDNRFRTPEIKSKVIVTYAAAGNLSVLVPATMQEHYEYGSNVIDCHASYSNFRPFTVNVQFQLGPSPKP